MDAITRHRLGALGLHAEDLEAEPLLERFEHVHQALVRHLPFENLSMQEVCRCRPHRPERWPRATDKVLRDHRFRGFGGASFSLAYALRDLLHGAGANAHLTLGRDLVTEETHAAVLVFHDGASLLYDATLFTSGPIPARPDGRFEDVLGTLFFEEATRGPCLTLRIEKRGGRGSHPAYSLVPAPAPPHRFRQAWVASFERGRRRPLRLARRRDNVIHRYNERSGRLEILREDGVESQDLGQAPTGLRHGLFGLEEGCLNAWFNT